MSVNDVLSRARSDIGLGEDPPGSNHNRTTVWYNENVERIGNGAWCEMSCTKWMWTGGAKALKRGRAYTVWGANDYRNGVNGGTWHWGTAGIQPGDQVYFDWSRSKGNTAYIDHTGIVEKVNADGTFYTIEGNIGDRCQRLHRDATYVVGYGRPNWAALVPNAPKPPAPARPAPKPVSTDPKKVRAFQGLLEIGADGQWGDNTDAWALRMRCAAQVHLGWPTKRVAAFREDLVQKVIDVTVDNVFGPKSKAALMVWVKALQRLLGVTPDGQWGPATDAAFLKFRAANHNKF